MGYDVLVDLGGKLLVLVVCFGGLSYVTERLVAGWSGDVSECKTPSAFKHSGPAAGRRTA